MLRSQFLTLLISAPLSLFSACHHGGGSAPDVPDIGASVPAGSGGIAIDMVGSWEIREAVVIESNAASPGPPAEGTIYVIEPDKVVTVGGISVDPFDLSLLLESPVTAYVNQVNGSTLFYGFIADRRASGRTREEVAVAGGALNANTVAIEAYVSTQQPTQLEAEYILSRYLLVRVASAGQLGIDLEDDKVPNLADLQSSIAGRF